jgi:single-strand DNA-binding protein
MLNKYIAIGNLTGDPKTQKVKDTSLVTFSLAINNPIKKDDVCFIDVETWGRTADNCAKFIKKGSKIFIEGRLKYGCWQTKTGEKRCKVSCVGDYVQFMDSKSDNLTKSDEPAKTGEVEEEMSSAEFDELSDIPF